MDFKKIEKLSINDFYIRSSFDEENEKVELITKLIIKKGIIFKHNSDVSEKEINKINFLNLGLDQYKKKDDNFVKDCYNCIEKIRIDCDLKKLKVTYLDKNLKKIQMSEYVTSYDGKKIKKTEAVRVLTDKWAHVNEELTVDPYDEELIPLKLTVNKVFTSFDPSKKVFTKQKYTRIKCLSSVFLNEKGDRNHVLKQFADDLVKKNQIFFDKETKSYALENSFFKQLKKNGYISEIWERISNTVMTKNNKLSFNEHVSLGVSSVSDILSENKGFSFGVEIETVGGKLNTGNFSDLNVQTTRDMSCSSRPDKKDRNGNLIREYCGKGAEYVTGVLTGDSGFKQLQKLLNTLSKTDHKINETCGIHVHVGGEKLKFSDSFIVACYKLGLMLEDEMFQVLPKSRRNGAFTRKMKKMDLVMPKEITKEGIDIWITAKYKQIFKLMSGGYEVSQDYNKTKNHPSGSARWGYNKTTPRYWWLNFVPAMFATKRPSYNENGSINYNYTLEFRSHNATLTYTKVRNWILLCFAFVWYCENSAWFVSL